MENISKDVKRDNVTFFYSQLRMDDIRPSLDLMNLFIMHFSAYFPFSSPNAPHSSIPFVYKTKVS